MTGSVLQRAIKLKKKLLAIRTGPAAASLPPEISRLHLNFAATHFEGTISRHKGAIKFCRLFLPQLKYHNPTVSMTVERSFEPSCPATLTIHYKDPSSTSTSTAPASKRKAVLAAAKTTDINLKCQTESEIVERLLEATKAKLIEPSPKDIQEAEWLKQVQQKSLDEALIMKAHNEKRKKQEEMMSAAKGVTA